ncbi:MAG: zinc-dependent alcohol dehydrogenase family protein [Mycobacteriales bacterium]|nr:MAG: alcohol dehydrogenase [Pseudonocardiales bacterium]
MRAVVVDEPGSWQVATVPDPAPGTAQIVVAVGACGVCGTDLHIFDGEFPPTPYPITPGHEFAGTVSAVGAGGSGIAEGTLVAVDPSLFCGTCAYCRAGRGNLCASWNAIGDTVSGAFAEYVVVPTANAYPLPAGFDLRRAAMIEPVSCAVHGVKQLDRLLGARALVIGAGTMGLLLAQLIHRAGATEVAVVDRNTARLGLVESLGLGPAAADVADLPAAEFDVAVDATGVPAAIESAFGALRRGGTLLVFGVADTAATVTLSPFRIYNDEIRIVGSMAVLDSFGPAVELVTSGTIDVGSLLADPFGLDGYGDALDAVRSGTGTGPKVQVVISR